MREYGSTGQVADVLGKVLHEMKRDRERERESARESSSDERQPKTADERM